MEGKLFYNKYIKPNIPATRKQWLLFILIIIGAIFFCAWGFNQLLESYFKYQLLQTPCQLCESLGNNCHQNLINNFTFNFSD